jgi:hypothetical protein
MERQYGALSNHLIARAAAGERQITLTFTELETAILTHPLPRTARHPRGHRQWWCGNGASYPHAWYGWQRIGWTVEVVELATETVTFACVGGGDG